VVRNACSRRPLASGRTFAIAWLDVRATVAYTCWYSAESTPLDGSVMNPRYPRLCTRWALISAMRASWVSADRLSLSAAGHLALKAFYGEIWPARPLNSLRIVYSQRSLGCEASFQDRKKRPGDEPA
jgi:hypothetical protein